MAWRLSHAWRGTQSSHLLAQGDFILGWHGLEEVQRILLQEGKRGSLRAEIGHTYVQGAVARGMRLPDSKNRTQDRLHPFRNEDSE